MKHIHELIAIVQGINPAMPLAAGFAAHLSVTAARATTEATAASFDLRRAELLDTAAAKVVRELLLRDDERDTDLAGELLRAGIPHPFPEHDDRADDRRDEHLDRIAA
jgi:hypothetical protein